MRALVVFESMFGNTRTIAEAVADGLRTQLDVDVAEVGSAPDRIDPTVDLLVVGGPTHAFTMSRASTRQDAAGRTPERLVSATVGLREWLGSLERDGAGMAAAVFDTRIARPKLPGSAAKAAGRRLRTLGFRLVGGPASFYVSDATGPLLPDEVARAREWAVSLAAAVQARQVPA